MAKRNEIDGDLVVPGSLVVLGGFQNSSYSRTVTRLSGAEENITTVTGEILDRPTYIEVTRYRFETRYKRSGTRPTAPTLADPPDWFVVAEEGEDALWMTGANINFDGTLIGTWYAPVRFSGASTIVGVLTNEQHAVPTDEQGESGNYVGAVSSLLIYEGSVDTTSLWTFGADPSGSVTGTRSGNTFTVTDLSSDVGFVDIIADRSGMSSITKRFSLTRSRLGDPVPAYRMGVSTSVVKIFTDGTIVPDKVVFNAVASIGLTEQAPYEGIFKFFVNDILQMQSSTPQDYFEWSTFEDYPADDSYPSDTDYPSFIFVEATTDVQIMRAELWSDDGLVRLDAQSIAFFKDVGFQLQDIIDATLEDIPNYVPSYLGKYLDSLPDVYRFGDWFLIYGIDNTPHVRGVYKVNQNLSITRISGDSGADASYMSAALYDVLAVTNTGYGILTDYGSITFIANLATNSIFTQAIQIGSGQVSGLGDLATLDEVTVEQVTGLGALAKKNLIEQAELGTTIINGGYIKTELLDVGTILGDDAIFTGTMQAAKGLFSGSISSGPLSLNIGSPSQSSTSTTGVRLDTWIKSVISSGIAPGKYPCSGDYNGQYPSSVNIIKGASYYNSTPTNWTWNILGQWMGAAVGTLYHFLQVQWSYNQYRTPFQLVFYDGGNNVMFNITGETWYETTWTQGALPGTEVAQMMNNPTPPYPQPVFSNADTAGTTCTNLAAGTISFTKDSYTMQLINLPAYSASLPAWTVYLQSDGGGNYYLKVKG